MPHGRRHDHRLRHCRRRADAPLQAAATGYRNLGRRHGLSAGGADVSAVHGDLRAQRLDHHHDGLCRGAAAGDPEDDRGHRRHPQGAGQCRPQLQSQRHAAVLENPVPGGAADDLRGAPARADLRADQYRRRRVPDQFRRPRPAHQRAGRALRSRRHLCGDLLRDPGEHCVLHGAGKGRAMAETGRLRRAAVAAPALSPVTLLRLAIILTVLTVWELLSHSGWLYRDVVPSLLSIGHALTSLFTSGDYYFNLGVTTVEILAALGIGGGCGLLVGILLGANRFLSKAFESYIYYLGPTPKIIFFPIMIMWFGVGPESKAALGTLSCFFPVALSVAAGMHQIDRVLIRVGNSFRANSWQMVTKIYLPAMRHPIINGIRLGLGVALIGTLLAETKLSNKGIGFLIINAYSVFDMPRMYANLIVLFVLAIGANALVGRFGGLHSIKRL